MDRITPIRPVVQGVSYFLAHVPGLVRLGSKPAREVAQNPGLLPDLLAHLRTYQEAVAYPPNQVFVGNLYPDDLERIPRPWFRHPGEKRSRWGESGEIMPEEEFYGVLKLADEFDLLWLEEGFSRQAQEALGSHPLMSLQELGKLGGGVPLSRVEAKVAEGATSALPLFTAQERLVGCVVRGHEEDINLLPEFVLENLAGKATAAMALRGLMSRSPSTGAAEDVEYLLGCGEEAVGDRYNRGGGSLAKAIGEMAGCGNATGADVKAFCCGPVHAIVIAGALVTSGVYQRVAVVGGCSLAKLGMKFQGHLKHDIPVLEDVLAAVAVVIGRDDGHSPVLRLDAVGRHTIDAGSAQQEIAERLVLQPIRRIGLGLRDVAKYATEMHNPEITEPSGSGNIPRTNYRLLAALGVREGELDRSQMEEFVQRHGMPGFSSTQGHIASAVPFLGHAVNRIRAGEMERAMFLAKGSLFLGRMTQMSDGVSFLLERNKEDG